MSEKNQKKNPRNKSSSLPGLAVRMLAVEKLDFVLKGNSFSPLLVSDMENGRDRAIVNRLVSLALRRHGHLSYIIKQLLKRGIPKRSGLFEAILRIGLVQLLFLEEMGAHSAIHLAVEGAKLDRRASRFYRVLNGVLRQAQRQALQWQNLNNELLFPKWLATRWKQQFGHSAFNSFGEALLEGAALDICLKNDDPELIEELGGQKLIFESVRIVNRELPVTQLAGFEGGQWWVQDVAATLAARLFDLNEGARVLDICAAPGGKTAQLVNLGYEVVALDNSPGRIKRLKQNLLRLNYGVQIVEGDGREFAPKQKFDGILVDAPCSATGTFRRHPEVLLHRDLSDIEGRVQLQRDIFSNAVRNLKLGGKLVFCVCSLHQEEGEAQAKWVSQNFPQLVALPVTPLEIGGIEGAIDQNGWVRTHPGLKVGHGDLTSMDGFFIARWGLS